LDLGGSANSLILPKGATASQPASTLEDGMIRFDTDKQNMSMYSSQAGSWLGLYQKTYVQSTTSATGDLLGSFDHTVILDASSNNIVQSVPAALSQYKDWELRYRAKNAASNTITILGATNNISYNGSLVTSIPMYDGEEVNMYSDGTLWYATKVTQLTVNNGLTASGTLAQLGGNLLRNTAITNNGFDLNILGSLSTTTFASNGNVGIGNNTPGFLLHVGSALTTSGTSVARFENAGGTCTVTPNTVGGINCTSDINWKKNISDLDYSALDKLAGVDIKSYNMKADSDGSQKQIGFIAQNLEQYFPSLVTTDNDGNKAVSYSGMTPILAKAVKELNAKVDAVNTTGLSSAAIQDMLINSNAVVLLSATDTATSTATSTILTDNDGNRTVADAFTHFVRLAIEKLDNYFLDVTLWANKVKANQICLSKSSGGEVCVTGDQLQAVLDSASVSTPSAPPALTPAPDNNSSNTEGNANGDTSSVDTVASSTDPIADNTSNNDTPAPSCVDPQVLDVATNACI